MWKPINFPFKLVIFLGLLLILIVLYLFPGSILGCFLYDDCNLQPQITPDYIVSTNHLYAFLLLSIIGFFTFKKWNQFFPLSIYLILLSISLELAHFIIPIKSFEFSDLFGNLIGVIIITIIVYFFKKNENIKN